MSALSYILDYGDDEGTQSDDSEKEDYMVTKKTKLPTPNLSRVSVVLEEKHIDDPSLHGSRTRSFPHVRGNWATFVFIEYPIKENFHKIIYKLETLFTPLDGSWIVCEDPHISLSRTFVLRYHMINSFTTSLQTALTSSERFDLNFDSFEVYCNEERTRTFLALKVDTSSYMHLLDLVKNVDNVLEDFRLPKFYEDPSFHMSILSINGNKKEELSKILINLNQIFTEQNRISININKIFCKSGNKTYKYCLK